MKLKLLCLSLSLLALFTTACADVDAPYEVKVNLDPTTTPAILPALTAGGKTDQRRSIFYLVNGASPNSIAIVRVRRTAKKSDVTVKLRGIKELSASVLSGTTLQEGDGDLEWDVNLNDTTQGKLSAAIKVEYADTTFATDGTTIRSMLTPKQRELLAIGARRPFGALSLAECPSVVANLYKDLPPPAGCDDATVEMWPFPDGPLYELSCDTETLDAARDGLRTKMAEVGAVAGPDQRGKTERSLALCQ